MRRTYEAGLGLLNLIPYGKGASKAFAREATEQAGSQVIRSVTNQALNHVDDAFTTAHVVTPTSAVDTVRDYVLQNLKNSSAARQASNFSTHVAIDAVYTNAQRAVELAKITGLTNMFGRFGTRAHQIFEQLNQATNTTLSKSGVQLVTEEFRDKFGNLASRFMSGSKGLDAYVQVKGQAVRGFDLKTGKTWTESVLQEVQRRFGVPVTQIERR